MKPSLIKHLTKNKIKNACDKLLSKKPHLHVNPASFLHFDSRQLVLEANEQ